MASVNKLSIRGVRAFSPDDEEQVVEFFFPVTIIVGANGCGKTTIIESLKYALSGSLPPGNKSGQAFVHDPRGVSQNVVKASVKLRLTNKAGSSMVVIRSMELTQKKTTMTFKQLDGVIRTVDSQTGARVSLSHKCSELDRQIPELMGVSKAILDYVLFVHQEDSSWPLAEASVLKKNFDQIFDSARYSKALESFRKTKKELLSKVKDIKVDVATYKSHKHAAAGFKREIEKQNDILAGVDQEIKDLHDEVTTKEQEKEDALQIIHEAGTLVKGTKAKENELANLRSSVTKQRSMLEEDFTTSHTIKDLREWLRDYDKSIKKKKELQEELQHQCHDIENEIESQRQKEMDLNSSKGKYLAEKDAHDNHVKERLKKMERLSQNYSVELQQSMTQQSRLDNSFTMSQVSMDASGTQGTTITLSKDDMDAFFSELDKKEESMKEEIRDHRASFREQENQLSAALTDLYGRKSSNVSDSKKLDTEQENIQRELSELQKITIKRMKKHMIEELRESAKSAAQQLERLNKNDNRDQITAEIRSCNEKIERLKEDIESKSTVRQNLMNSAQLGNKIAIMKDQFRKDMEAFQDSVEKEAHTLRSVVNVDIPDELPDEGDELLTLFDTTVSNAVSSKYETTKGNLKKLNDDVTKQRRVVSQESATLYSQKQSMESLNKQREDLLSATRGVAKIQGVIEEMNKAEEIPQNHGYTIQKNPQVLLDFLDQAAREVEDNGPDDIPFDSMKKTLRRIKRLSKKAGKEQCPCCRRDFNGAERNVFAETMKQLADPNTSPLMKVDSEDREKYLALKGKIGHWRETVVDSMTDLNNVHRIEKELQELEPIVKAFDTQVKQREAELVVREKELSQLQDEENKLRNITVTARHWAETAKRIAEQQDSISTKVDQLRAETADSLGENNLETVEEQLNKMREEKDDLVDKINKLNRQITTINQNITNASQKASSTAELLRKREEKYAEQQAATEKTKQLNERLLAISQEKTNLGDELSSIQSKIKAKESEKTRLQNHFADEDTKRNETLNMFSNDIKELRNLNSLIEQYNSANKSKELERLTADVAKIAETIKEKKEMLASLQPELDAATKAVDDQERQEKLLAQNIEVLECEEQIMDLEKEIDAAKEELEQIEGYDTAQAVYNEAQQRIYEINSKMARHEGRRQEIVEQIRSLNRKLSSDEYRDVDKQYTEAIIKQETTQMAVNDLEKYATALDKALLRFHVMKLEEINKIIKELWMMCYKGEDISYIQIVSGQEKAAAKSYNYRVVMAKGTTELDMRGRCSAGQRVLASIVIRLALAETFGVCFGCLVLDEPTVNLDYHNKQGLATALAQIIATRSKQSNFQLVLITHDEDFVTMMKGELSTHSGFSLPEKYFQVRREEGMDGKYYSKIDPIDWDELL